MDKVRIGIVGMGNMGKGHAKYLMEGKVPQAELTAICDSDPARLEAFANEYGDKVKRYEQVDDFLKNAPIDGVLVATPHYFHPEIAIKAFQNNLHVLIEKPAGVYTKQVREMNEVAEKSGKVFGIMYNQRTNPVYQKVRDLIISGELGEIKRTCWIITNWYRPQSYYDSGVWRGTWEGEGGGVLINQAPHQLDLWQWICGLPKRVRAFCHFGKYHDIEVEDDVTAYVEYENGATGTFITTTGEAPGTNRLEIAGDRGKIVVEDDKITFWRLRESERVYNKSTSKTFGAPECWKCEIPVKGTATGHAGITTDWVNAILKGTPLLAPGVEGIRGLEISNAMYLSTWIDDWVEIPVDEDLFYSKLQEMIQKSKSRAKK
ncbi:MAG TPA: Gfo/Idh/MocA family oxidoreductase [Clostridiaceae bacterium]|nr:Gfo/Idh/MocA family oxidoreductase [Clostridiaceae bacterium]